MPTSIEKLRARFVDLLRREPEQTEWYDGPALRPAASAWLLEALTTVQSTLGPASEITRRMRAAVDYVHDHIAHGPEFRLHSGHLAAASGAFRAAKAIVDGDALLGLIDLVRAETEADLLDHAEQLLTREQAPHVAAVVAGGALETHLYRLCLRHEIKWQGDRGINAYNNAIASARKKDPSLPLYSHAQGDAISAWAKIANDGRHEPLVFRERHKPEYVRSMVDGIRQFFAGGT